jgi:hypothetical protein
MLTMNARTRRYRFDTSLMAGAQRGYAESAKR